MPIKRCTKDGKSGWKYGDSGTCYTGSNAKSKAEEQAAAIHASGYVEKALIEFDKLFEEYKESQE